MALIPICSMVFIPIFSGIVVVVGKKGFFLLLAASIACGNFWVMETMEAVPSFKVTICILVTGLFYSVYSSVIWSSMTLVVPQQGTSVALGLATTIQNVLMTTLPIYFGVVNEDRTIKAYNSSLFSLRLLALGGMLSAVMVIIVDFKTGQRINLPENDKRVLKLKEKATDDFRRATNITEGLLS